MSKKSKNNMNNNIRILEQQIILNNIIGKKTTNWLKLYRVMLSVFTSNNATSRATVVMMSARALSIGMTKLSGSNSLLHVKIATEKEIITIVATAKVCCNQEDHGSFERGMSNHAFDTYLETRGGWN